MIYTFQSPVEPTQTTDLCRYCLMCRHVCPVTHITRNEATSPHGWGLLISSVARGLAKWDADTVDILYQCADCGLCRAHCATDQPLPLAINAARADVAARGLAPDVAYEVQQKLQRWGNLYTEAEVEPATAQGEAALLVGPAHHLRPQTVEAAQKLLAAAGVQAVPVAVGRETPYLANTLGFPAEARALAEATLAEIEAVGAQRVFVLAPGDIYTYTILLDYLGLAWPESVALMELEAFLADQVEAGRLAFGQFDPGEGYAFYDPDHTVRVAGRWEAPRRLLAAVTSTAAIPLFWREARAAPCGTSGGLPLTQPELAADLARARLVEAQARGVTTLISDDPQVVHHLQQYAGDLEIVSLLELLAKMVK